MLSTKAEAIHAIRLDADAIANTQFLFRFFDCKWIRLFVLFAFTHDKLNSSEQGCHMSR